MQGPGPAFFIFFLASVRNTGYDEQKAEETSVFYG